jgi:hypothetical protein
MPAFILAANESVGNGMNGKTKPTELGLVSSSLDASSTLSFSKTFAFLASPNPVPGDRDCIRAKWCAAYRGRIFGFGPTGLHIVPFSSRRHNELAILVARPFVQSNAKYFADGVLQLSACHRGRAI